MPPQKSEYLSDVWKDGIFNGKVIFCTGGAGSICSAQVRAMVYLGANACIVGRNVENTEKTAKDIATIRPGAKVVGIGGTDVRKLDSLKSAAERCARELGGIDFVIAGAAGNFLAGIKDVSANAFKSVIDIDLIGSFNTVKATIPFLLESVQRHSTKASTSGTYGRIIFVSAALHYSGTPFQAPASAAKAGVDSLAVSVAIEYGPRGINSNILAPGPIAGTEGLERLSRKDAREKSMRMVPSGRFGTVKEIADATIFLFSDAGNYVNGACVVVDGGQWHIGTGTTTVYPDMVLQDEPIGGVKSGKKPAAKL